MLHPGCSSIFTYDDNIPKWRLRAYFHDDMPDDWLKFSAFTFEVLFAIFQLILTVQGLCPQW